jgi:hypothetical protein
MPGVLGERRINGLADALDVEHGAVGKAARQS